MTKHQLIALNDPCRLAGECVKRCYGYTMGIVSIVLTVNSGYE